jgi:dihydropteroate synthase
MHISDDPISTFNVTGNRSVILKCADKILNLSVARVMGVLNVTPDSFSDQGRYFSFNAAIKRAEQIISEGAAIIDIGGESTRPGAIAVSVQEELDRIIPVIEAVRAEFDVIISVDTHKPVVIREAISAGADFINDITALQDPRSLQVIANSGVAVCLMHMQGEPKSMQIKPYYADVIAEVSQFLRQQLNTCLQAGIAKERIVVDPGFGFGKLTAHNLHLLKYLNKLQALGQPLLVGFSRKATIGEILKLPAEQRLFGSIAAHVIAVCQGAAIVRTHDVKPTVEAITMATAVLTSG